MDTMDVNAPRERCLNLALGVGEVLNAVIVGMECSDGPSFDVDAAIGCVTPSDDDLLAAALTLLAALFSERDILPHEIFDRTPLVMANIALQDLE